MPYFVSSSQKFALKNMLCVSKSRDGTNQKFQVNICSEIKTIEKSTFSEEAGTRTMSNNGLA